MDNAQKMYVGPRGVQTVAIEEMKTASGADVVTVYYDGGYSELMTKKTYELISSTKPTDFTAIRNKKFIEMTKELYPMIAEYITYIVSDMTPENKSSARHIFLNKVMSILTEYNISVAEVEPFLNPFLAEFTGLINSISFEIDNTFNRATNYLWTKNDKDFVPGTDMMSERTLLEAQKVNREIPIIIKEENKNEPEPETTE